MIILFLAVWVFVTGSIGTWRQLNGKERWSLVKIGAYGLLTGMLAGYAINSILHSKSESSEPEKTSSSSSSSSWGFDDEDSRKSASSSFGSSDSSSSWDSGSSDSGPSSDW